MKIAGREIKGPNRVTLVLPREGGEDIVLFAQAVLDWDEFDEKCPEPKPPVVRTKDGVNPDFSDLGYKAQAIDHGIKRMAYLTLKSLEPSNIEWETVNMDKPSTWTNYNKELRDAGFSVVEIQRIGAAVMQANALDEEKLEAARQVFLRGRAAEQESISGPSTQP